jgi:hypothetical protein
MIKLVDIDHMKSYESDDKDDTHDDEWRGMGRVSRNFFLAGYQTFNATRRTLCGI